MLFYLKLTLFFLTIVVELNQVIYMKKYTVKGMSCAACVSRVENAVSAVTGVESCSVNLLTNSLFVEGDVVESDIALAVENAGYEIVAEKSAQKVALPLKELVFSVLILVILMWISMGKMLGLPLPEILENPVINGVWQLVLSFAVLMINSRFFKSGFLSLIHLAPNMDTLVSLGSGVSFLYSVFLLFKTVLTNTPSHYYFESAAMIVTLISVGKMLEGYSKGKTTNALKSLMALSPTTATVLLDGEEKKVPVENLKIGDVFVVRPGEKIAVDAVVVKGASSVDESALTGESVPSDKAENSKVFGGTLNLSGYLECKAVALGEDSVLGQIIKMMTNASASKAPVQKVADKVAGVFVPVVLLISLITAVVWLILGKELDYSLTRAISVLVISCPCALGLATPVAIMVASGVGAKHNVLFKTATSLETVGKVKTVLLDKTGTITKGSPEVVDFKAFDENLFSVASTLEKMSEHPLGKAVFEFSKERGEVLECQNFLALSGVGVVGEVLGEKVFGANEKFIKTVIDLPETVLKTIDEFSLSGKTPVVFASEKRVFGVFALADTLKEDSERAISQLKKLGVRVVMLTGDSQNTANAIAKKVGIENVVAEVLPQNKAECVEKEKETAVVMMVGDGINDAVALKTADVGVAIASGTDIAIDSADVVLMKNSLSDVVTAIKLSRKTLWNIRENLFWAFLYNVLGIPLAAGLFGWQLNPMFGAAAMSLSSFCVVSNALRLNLFKANKKENTKMEVVLKIEGMMCPHCEAHVTKALMEVGKVEKVVASHKDGTAVITACDGADLGALKMAVENAGYKVIG